MLLGSNVSVTRNIPSEWFPRSYKLNEQSLQCKIYLIYSTQISPFFNTIPKQTDKIHSSWYTFKNYTAAENGFLHLQPLTNSHFHFLFLIFVVPCIMLYNCEISPTGCNNCVLFFAMALLYTFRATFSPIIRSTYAVYGHR